jgi:hypothetical protein
MSRSPDPADRLSALCSPVPAPSPKPLAPTSNREPPEILTMMADSLLAQSAIDRLRAAAYELVVEGESYRQRQKRIVRRAREQP